MSALSYEQEYQQALVDLEELQREDVFVASARVPGDAKKRNAFFLQFWVSIYVRYLRLAKRLTVIHEVELQPQKLHDVRTLLDCCLGRMLEAKRVLVANCGDFLSLDNILLDMKLTPDEVEAPIPAYITDDRSEELMQQRNYILSVQAHYVDTEPEAPVSVVQSSNAEQLRKDPTKALVPLPVTKASAAAAAAGATAEVSEPLTLEEAVKVLQVCERGRQARQRARFQVAIYRQQRHSAAHGQDFNTVTGKDRAATIVQRVVQGYLARKESARRHEEEKRFLGLVATNEILSNADQVAAVVRRQERRAKQRINVAELQRKTIDMENKLKAKEGPHTMEEMLDEILMRMAYARLESKDGALIDFPSPEEGGSLKLLARLDRAAESGGGGGGRRLSSRSRGKSVDSSAMGSTSGGRGASGSVGGTRRKSITSVGGGSNAGGAGRKKEDAEGGDAAAAMEALTKSTFWLQMREGAERHEAVWRDRFVRSYVERGEFDQPGDEMMLQQELLDGPRGIMNELRSCVDQLVMMEVTNLKERLDAEKNSKRKKKKKAKKERKPKKPKLKDPTKGVNLETSINTMIYENKLQLPPSSVRLADFIGSANVMASPLDAALRTRSTDEEIKKKWQKVIKNWNEDVETALKMKREVFEKLFAEYLQQSSWLAEPSAAQIRRFITEHAVLPLGSQVIHDLAPDSNTMLMYGFPEMGKTMLAFAICNESGANFFNLSPGNFPTTKGIAKAIQLVFYLARMKGPSVIYLDHIEKIFPAKKGGKKAKDALIARGKKMKKELIKGLASIQPCDRVLLIGTSSEPWLADSAALTSVFKHAVYVPLPDYATRLELIQAFAGEVAPEAPPMPSDALRDLGLLTDGFSTGQLRTVMQKTLHPRRLQRIMQHPLTGEDFVAAVASMKAHTPAERGLMRGFHVQLPHTMRRANPMEDFKESEEEAKKRKNSVKRKSKAA